MQLVPVVAHGTEVSPASSLGAGNVHPCMVGMPGFHLTGCSPRSSLALHSNRISARIQGLLRMGEACTIVAEVAALRKAAAEADRGPESFRLGSITMTPVQPFHAHGGLPAAREAAAGRPRRRAAQDRWWGCCGRRW